MLQQPDRPQFETRVAPHLHLPHGLIVGFESNFDLLRQVQYSLACLTDSYLSRIRKTMTVPRRLGLVGINAINEMQAEHVTGLRIEVYKCSILVHSTAR